MVLNGIVSVLHQDEGGIGKSFPDAREISRGRGFCTPRPEGFTEGEARGKSRGSRGKVYSEAEKNNPMGSNTQCAGVIPDMDMQGSGFNPFSYFKTYNSLLPTEPHSKYQKYFLFPMGRVSGKAKNSDGSNFDLHDPSNSLFQPNQKSKFNL